MDRPITIQENGRFVALHTTKGAEQRGYPTTRVEWGARTLDELTTDINMDLVDNVKRVGKAAAVITYKSGARLYRLHNTNIVQILKNGSIIVNTGGWNTITTFRHIQDFLSSQGIPVNVSADKKGRGVLLRDLREDTVREARFAQACICWTNGAWEELVGDSPRALNSL